MKKRLNLRTIEGGGGMRDLKENFVNNYP